MSTTIDLSELPPGASPTASRLARAMYRPIERFLRIEAASGILLLFAAAVALAWANSPWAASYVALWETPVNVGARGASVDVTLHFVVNDVLMTVFFFVVGLEIKRELHAGELSDARRAALPIFAALGGMVVPALIYLAFNRGDLARGWGVPMATDIAFAVGVLTVLGTRVAPSVRVFLLALAIIDDIGAILVIALFYSTGLDGSGLALAFVGMAGIVGLQRVGARHSLAYAVPAALIWFGIYRAGIHPAIAGVIVGLMTPAMTWYGPQRFANVVHELAETTKERSAPLAQHMARLRHAQREVMSPVERIVLALHPWVAFAILPLFALANAGVAVAGAPVGETPTIVIGIVAGLVIGKPLGIVAATALAVRTRMASLPRGLTWRGVVLVGVVAGIGFTMALFVAEIAFVQRAELHGVAKLAVLLSSTTAAIAAICLGRTFSRRDKSGDLAANGEPANGCAPHSRARIDKTRLGIRILAVFFAIATCILVCVSLSLVWPDSVFNEIWRLRSAPRPLLDAHREIVVPAFLALAVVMAVTSAGCFARTRWARQLAIGIFVTNAIGDLGQGVMGNYVEGAIGVAAAGLLVTFLMRSNTKAVFARPG